MQSEWNNQQIKDASSGTKASHWLWWLLAASFWQQQKLPNNTCGTHPKSFILWSLEPIPQGCLQAPFPAAHHSINTPIFLYGRAVPGHRGPPGAHKWGGGPQAGWCAPSGVRPAHSIPCIRRTSRVRATLGAFRGRTAANTAHLHVRCQTWK